MSDGKTTSFGGVRDFQSFHFHAVLGQKFAHPLWGNPGSTTAPVIIDSIYSLKNSLLHGVMNPPGDFNIISL